MSKESLILILSEGTSGTGLLAATGLRLLRIRIGGTVAILRAVTTSTPALAPDSGITQHIQVN